MAFSRETIISATIWKLLERFSTQIASFVITILLARILMPEEYGIIAMLTIFISIANVIIDGGLNTALIQKKDADNIDFSTILIASLAVATFLYVVLFFCAPYISSFYSVDILTPVLRVLSLNLIIISFNSIQRAYVSKYMLFGKLFYSSFFSVLLSGTISIYLAYSGWGVWALVAQQLLLQILTSIIMWFTIKWRPIFVFSVVSFKGLFNYGWKILVTNLIISFYENVRSLVIGRIYKPSSLAYYDRGRQFPDLIMININTSLQTVLLPAFAEVQDDKIRLKEMMRRSLKLSCFCVFPFLTLMFVCAKPMVLVLLTSKWLMAVPFIQIFCVAQMLMPIQSSNMAVIKAMGFSNIILKYEVYKKLLETCVMAFSFAMGLYAIAYGVVIYNFLCLFINLHPTKKIINYGIGEQIRDVAPILLVSLIMGVCVYVIAAIISNNLFLLLIVQLSAGFGIYFILSKMLKIDSFNYIVTIIKRKK